MPKIEKMLEGQICWLELAAKNAESAKNFYIPLFEWEVREIPMGENMSYYMCHRGGYDIAAFYQMQEERLRQGERPSWWTYFLSFNVDQTSEKAKELGGKVLMNPFDVFDSGRMAVIQDPQGAIFGVWQPKNHKGFRIFNEHGAWGWSELLAKDVEKAVEFYKNLFRFEIEKTKMEKTDYISLKKEGMYIAGMMQMQPEWGDIPSIWTVYFNVRNCEEIVDKAKELGANIVVPPTKIEGIGIFSNIQDPEGAFFGIIEYRRS